MDPAGLPALEEAIRNLHGAEPRFVETVLVYLEIHGQLVWDGEVQVFDLTGHATAPRAYAWSYATTGERRQFVAVLHVPGVESAEAAVKAYIVAKSREGRARH